MANTLVFVDFPTPDPVAAQQFYEQVFGWTIEPRPEGDFHRAVPGEGLHLGIYNEATQTPDPSPGPVAPRSGPATRTYILVDEEPMVYVRKAVELGGKQLWGEEYWGEFDGWHASFADPWGNQIVLWYKGKPAPGS
jgi:predicted enzyme related to lactoylglutathione lyase